MAANKRANVRQRGPFCPVWFRHLTALFDSFARDAEGIITARGGSGTSQTGANGGAQFQLGAEGTICS